MLQLPMQFGRNERSIITQIVQYLFMRSKVDSRTLKDGGEGEVRDANEGFVGWNDVIVIAATASVDETGQCGGGEEGDGGMLSIVQD